MNLERSFRHGNRIRSDIGGETESQEKHDSKLDRVRHRGAGNFGDPPFTVASIPPRVGRDHLLSDIRGTKLLQIQETRGNDSARLAMSSHDFTHFFEVRGGIFYSCCTSLTVQGN